MCWIIPAENSWDTEPFFKKSKNTTNEAEETERGEAYFQSVGKEKQIIKKYICACTAHCSTHLWDCCIGSQDDKFWLLFSVLSILCC